MKSNKVFHSFGNTIHCKSCNGTGRKKLSRKLQETADAFSGRGKTTNEVYADLVAQGKLNGQNGSGGCDTVVHARVKRLCEAGVIKKGKKTPLGWTFVKV